MGVCADALSENAQQEKLFKKPVEQPVADASPHLTNHTRTRQQISTEVILTCHQNGDQ